MSAYEAGGEVLRAVESVERLDSSRRPRDGVESHPIWSGELLSGLKARKERIAEG